MTLLQIIFQVEHWTTTYWLCQGHLSCQQLKNYILQMTVWLQWQEVVDWFQAYLNWFQNGSFLPLPTSQHPHLLENCGDSHSWENDDDASADDVVDDDVLEVTNSSTCMSYKIAKHHPPALHHISAATHFLDTFHTYVTRHWGSIVHQMHDSFNLWSHIEFHLPHIPKASDNKSRNIVHVSPPVSPSGAWVTSWWTNPFGFCPCSHQWTPPQGWGNTNARHVSASLILLYFVLTHN